MKLPSVLLLLCSTFSFELTGQNNWCLSEDQTILRHDVRQEYIERMQEYATDNWLQARSEKWIRVVVHVVTDDPYDVTRAEVLHQIDVLNRDFEGKGENVVKLPDEFKDLVADSGIRFCLADTDPEGNPATGITYTETDVTGIALQRDIHGNYILYYDHLGGKSGWDPERYINIWVASFGNGLIGFATLPGTASFPEEMGIVIDPSAFGSLGPDMPFLDRGHTLTHEMGHYLGLLHIWGSESDSCEDSDEIEDTPNSEGPYLGCPNGIQVSCGERNMYQNFMDLTDDRCLAAFTHGQAARMNSMIELFYPDLTATAPCTPQSDDFDQWSDELIWAYDSQSREYVVYSPEYFQNELTIDVFSTDGRLVLHDTWDGLQTYLIDIGVPGVYFVRLLNGTSQHVRKISVH